MPSFSKMRLSVVAVLAAAGAIGAWIDPNPTTAAEPAPPARADQESGEAKQNSWSYPGSARLIEHGSASTAKRDGKVVSQSRDDVAEYTSDDPFHQVVRFYAELVGLEPPDWIILDREFPGDYGDAPAMATMFSKGKSIVVRHYIRPKTAIAGFLVIDDDGGETVSVTVTRALDDEKTYIAVMRHTRETPPRGDDSTIKK